VRQGSDFSVGTTSTAEMDGGQGRYVYFGAKGRVIFSRIGSVEPRDISDLVGRLPRRIAQCRLGA